MSGLLAVTPEALWSAVIVLGLLALFALSAPGRRLIKVSRSSAAPRLLLCVMYSLGFVLVGWLALMANMEVRQPGLVSRILMSAIWPGFFVAELLGFTITPFNGVPFVAAVSCVSWALLLYGIWSGIARWNALRAAA